MLAILAMVVINIFTIFIPIIVIQVSVATSLVALRQGSQQKRLSLHDLSGDNGVRQTHET